MEDRLLLTTYVVNNTNNSGSGSLRQAILDSNGNAGTNTITFDITGSGVHTISPTSPLATITNPVILDGTSEPGYNGSPLIVLTGTGAGAGANGLTITAGASTVKGLVINSFKGNGIALQTMGNNVIIGNYIGTDATGTVAAANGSSGVNILSGSNNTIGGTTAAARNLLSGNTGYGLAISGNGTQVRGNYIGTTISGAMALGNTSGVYVFGADNTIGGTATGAGNVIAGNTFDGVFIPSGEGNLLQANLIGTGATGIGALPNGRYGVNLAAPAVSNTIGGTTAAARNLISANKSAGVFILGNNNTVEGNYIGTTITAGDAQPNGEGVVIRSTGNLVGGTTPGAGNLISGNTNAGVDLTGGDNQVQGNLIGTNALGQKTLANGIGVSIAGSNNIIGGTEDGALNLISGNTADGVLIVDGGNDMVEGNLIGTDVTGTDGLRNLNDGVTVGGSGSNLVISNVVSANGANGIEIRSDSNILEGNLIGTDVSGTVALGNNQDGIFLAQANSNAIGGIGAGNVISANGGSGINLQSGSNNLIQGNVIGTDVTEANPLGNALNGVYVAGSNNTIGGRVDGAGNLIDDNGADGVAVDTGTGNAIQQNSIGLNAGLGIDLLNNGNNNAAAPVLKAVRRGDGTTAIAGTLTSTPSSTFTVELFTTAECDASGQGQGEVYLGSVTVTTDANGFAGFWYGVASDLDPTQFVTATATNASNNTSAFSLCLPLS
jgi:titin